MMARQLIDVVAGLDDVRVLLWARASRVPAISVGQPRLGVNFSPLPLTARAFIYYAPAQSRYCHSVTDFSKSEVNSFLISTSIR